MQLGAAEWISILSAIFAAASAIFAWRQAAQAQKSASAAHGDVEPTFEVFLHGALPVVIQCRVANFNRKSIVLRELKIRAIDYFDFRVGFLNRDGLADAAPRKRNGEIIEWSFDRFMDGNQVLGVAPNSAEPIRKLVLINYSAVNVGLDQAQIEISVRWQYMHDEKINVARRNLLVRLGGQ